MLLLALLEMDLLRQVCLSLFCCPTGFMVWAPSSHRLPSVLSKTHCSADIPKVANKCPVFSGLHPLCFACLPVVPGVPQPQLALGVGCWRFASWECPVSSWTGMQGMLQTDCSHGAVWGLVTASSRPWISIWDCQNKHTMAGL